METESEARANNGPHSPPIDRAELKRLCAEASEGPWTVQWARWTAEREFLENILTKLDADHAASENKEAV